MANVAKYLARFGQKVFAIDFDLEAPGLHYKLGLDRQTNSKKLRLGVLDYIHAFACGEGVPKSLRGHTVEVDRNEESGGCIYLMPAGDAPSTNYWRRLAKINWHDLFYTQTAKGIPFFLELRERIKKEYAPDFLLIDSRTGITEIGGVATTLLPDKLVCLLLNNSENLEGAREVLRSIKQAPRLPDQQPIEIIPVVTRIPKMGRLAVEEGIISDIREFLNEKGDDSSAVLNIPEVFILHSEPELQILESLRIGGDKNPDESPLLRDYLRLFSRLISKDVLEPYIGPLIHAAKGRVLDDPEAAQRDLEALAASCPHPDVYEALIKLYHLRRDKDEVVLGTASRFYELTAKANQPMLWDVIRAHYRKPQKWDDYPIGPDFIEDVWDAAGANNVEIGLLLAEHCDSVGREDQAAEVLVRLLRNTEPLEKVVVSCIDQLRKVREWSKALEIIELYKTALSESTAFYNAWARLVVSKGDKLEAEKLMASFDLQVGRIKEEEFVLYARLLSLTERNDELLALMDHTLTRALEKGRPSEFLAEVGEYFTRFGRRQEFEQKVRHFLGREADDFLRHISVRSMRRWGRPWA